MGDLCLLIFKNFVVKRVAMVRDYHGGGVGACGKLLETIILKLLLRSWLNVSPSVKAFSSSNIMVGQLFLKNFIYSYTWLTYYTRNYEFS